MCALGIVGAWELHSGLATWGFHGAEPAPCSRHCLSPAQLPHPMKALAMAQLGHQQLPSPSAVQPRNPAPRRPWPQRLVCLVHLAPDTVVEGSDL